VLQLRGSGESKTGPETDAPSYAAFRLASRAAVALITSRRQRVADIGCVFATMRFSRKLAASLAASAALR
jgi:hypothetical protein